MAFFKIGRFGKSDSDLKFQDVVEGNIFDMADKVIEILRSKYLTSPIHYEGLLRKEVLEYPEVALREAILNAIIHKDYTGAMIQLSVYDDKLMLWNPGSLPDEVRGHIKDKHPSRPRNATIAQVFFKAGFIEAWGRGISKIMEACKAAGLPEPEIKEDHGGIWVTFSKDIYSEEYLQKLGLNFRQVKAILHKMGAGNPPIADRREWGECNLPIFLFFCLLNKLVSLPCETYPENKMIPPKEKICRKNFSFVVI